MEDKGAYNGEGHWMQTYSGGKFWPLAPRAEDIRIQDIAHALSLICRFGGHCTEFYSVAQHSVLVSRLVPARMAMWGLLHDAPEAYIGDIPRPLKRQLWFRPDPHDPQVNHLRAAEAILHQVVRLALPHYCEHDDVKFLIKADNVALRTEARDLMGDPQDWDWPDDIKPLLERIEPLPPQQAEALFMFRYKELREQGL